LGSTEDAQRGGETCGFVVGAKPTTAIDCKPDLTDIV
jgi:hypothetical protein